MVEGKTFQLATVFHVVGVVQPVVQFVLLACITFGLAVLPNDTDENEGITELAVLNVNPPSVEYLYSIVQPASIPPDAGPDNVRVTPAQTSVVTGFGVAVVGAVGQSTVEASANSEKPLKPDRLATGGTAATWLPLSVQLPPPFGRLIIRVFVLNAWLLKPVPVNASA